MLSMGIGYYTLHSSCGTYLAIGQDTQYPLEGISLYKCYSGCAFQFLQVLHCTVATHWARTSAGGSSSLSGAQVKCTYLHLVVMVAGPRSPLDRQEVEVEARSQRARTRNSSSVDFSFFRPFLRRDIILRGIKRCRPDSTRDGVCRRSREVLVF